ncbi:MAG: gliding motility protein GldN [Bacteroidales bacterium]|nr:gliding motility protein GldN [Bacteroidales bacterium]
MKRVVLFLISAFVVLGSFTVNAQQDFLTEVYTREHIRNKQPVPYAYVREADVVWAKDIYRIVDLRQKQNLPLYYPLRPIGDRMSLISLLLHGIDNEGVRAFSTTDVRNEFIVQMTKDDIDEAFDAGVDTLKVPDVNTGQMIESIIESERKVEEVQQIMVKEKWFFDRNHSVMKVQIVGLCPIRVYAQRDDQNMPTDVILKKKTFWVYFPEIRPILANHEIFNRNNDAQRISFDDYFWQRRFDSYIVAESNVYDNRTINSYTLGIDSQLEAERIKQNLFETEHDLWEY